MRKNDSASGTGWELYTEGNVLVGVFSDKSAFDETAEITESFTDLLAPRGVNAHVACIEMDKAAGNKMLEGAGKAARKGVEEGLEKWGIADPGIGKLAVKNHVDIDGLEVEGFDSREEAIQWASE
jgi:hypothetical protein